MVQFDNHPKWTSVDWIMGHETVVPVRPPGTQHGEGEPLGPPRPGCIGKALRGKRSDPTGHTVSQSRNATEMRLSGAETG